MKIAMRHFIGALVGAIVLAASLMAPAQADSATEELSTSNYYLIVTTFGANSSGVAGGYIFCSSNSKVATGGASSYPGYLTNSSPTLDGTGWYATGYVGAGRQLTVLLQCIRNDELVNNTYSTIKVRRHTANWNVGATRPCAPGTTLYSGGGYFNKPFSYPSLDAGGQIYASVPSGNGWYFRAYADPSLELNVNARCLPSAQVAATTNLTRTFYPPTNGGLAGGIVRCPTGTSALTGGAWLHASNSTTPSNYGYLRTSYPTSTADGWYTEAWAYAGGAVSITVRCSP